MANAMFSETWPAQSSVVARSCVFFPHRKPREEMQSGHRDDKHEPCRVLPIEQKRFGRSEIQAKQPNRQKELRQRTAPAARLNRLKIPERPNNENQDRQQ